MDSYNVVLARRRPLLEFHILSDGQGDLTYRRQARQTPIGAAAHRYIASDSIERANVNVVEGAEMLEHVVE